MPHTEKDKKRLLARISKIRGQVSGLEKLLDNEHKCLDVLQQISAIRGAVNGLMKEVIKEHIVEHIVCEEDLTKRETEMEEVLKILHSYMK